MPDPVASQRSVPDPADSDRHPISTIDLVSSPSETGSLDAQSTPVRKPANLPASGTPSIPGYVIEAEIARGGMGRVYRGHELVLNREVAIKTLLTGASAERFVVESQITARLPHPGIPPVYALGTLSDGMPFLAMKLVRGRTLADLLKERASPAENLPRYVQIFEQIAQAVGFAHSQGIVHRDLKPSNVMVGAFGEVQVMDWGLAKEVRRQKEEGTGKNEGDGSRNEQAAPTSTFSLPPSDFSSAGSILGTPGYMPPEQARGEIVDARADVFSLGSILATILTGKPAFVGAAIQEIMAKSAKGDLTDALGRFAACGADSELVALAKRCLAIDPADRPADAHAVAEQVAAYRTGVEQRVRQAETQTAEALVREAEQRKRNRILQIGGGVLVAVLVLGVAGTSLGMYWENQARQQAQRQLKQIEKGIDLLASLLRDIDPQAETQGKTPLFEQLAERANQAADELDGEAVGDPLAVARLQTILGNTLGELGNYPKAIEVLQKAHATRERELGPEHPDTLVTLHHLATVYGDAGEIQRARQLIKQVHELQVKVLGNDHPATLATLNDLAHSGEHTLVEKTALLEQIRAGRVKHLGAEHPDTLATLGELAIAKANTGHNRQTIELIEQVLEVQQRKFGPEHPVTLRTRHVLAHAYQAGGQPARALPMIEQIRDVYVKKWAPDHPSVLGIQTELATYYGVADRVDEAVEILERIHQAQEKKLGADHPGTLTTLANLTAMYMKSDKYTERAIEILEAMRETLLKKYGGENEMYMRVSSNLALAYRTARQHAKSIELLTQVHQYEVQRLGANHPDTLSTLHQLARAYHAADNFPKASDLYEAVRAAQLQTPEANHSEPLTLLEEIGMATHGAGRLKRAIEVREELLAEQVKTLGANHRKALRTQSVLAACYCEAGAVQRGIDLYVQTQRDQEQALGADHEDTLVTMHDLAAAYQAIGLTPLATKLLEDVRDLQVKKLGIEHASTLRTLDDLAKVYHNSGKLPQAIGILDQIYKTQVKSLGEEHEDTLTALNNLARSWHAAGAGPAAIPMYEKVLAGRLKTIGPDHVDTLTTLEWLGQAYQKDDLPRAIELFEQLRDGQAKTLGPHHPKTTMTQARLVYAYRDANQFDNSAAAVGEFVAGKKIELAQNPDEMADYIQVAGEMLMECEHAAAAEEQFRECLRIREGINPNKWEVFMTQSMLGGALVSQKKLAEAEPLLLKGYGGLKDRKGLLSDDSKAIPRAIDRLIEFSFAADRLEEMCIWQEERAKYPPAEK